MEQLFKDLERQFGIESTKKARDVVIGIKAKIAAKNLFGWRTFIEEVIIELVGYMIKTDFKYSGGAYVVCGMQSAIDKCRYCNAQKRRGNYETVSLDTLYYVPDTRSSYINQADELVISIKLKFGEDFANLLKPFLYGEQDKLSRDVLKKCKEPEFANWFKDYVEGK